VWATGGCAPADRTELIKEVLDTDPSFRAVLQKRDEYANRIDTLEREVALKRETVKRSIAQMRQELTQSLKTVRERKAHFRTLLEPDHERYELALAVAGEELRAKRSQQTSVNRSIAALRKTLGGAQEWSADERRRQEAQLREMERDGERLTHETDALQEHIRLLKIKLLLLRL